MVAAALVVVIFVIDRISRRHQKVAERWARGARAEVGVGQALNELRRSGYVVMHDIDTLGRGNVDHFVSGPSGVYIIETKFRRYEQDHLRKTKRRAAQVGAQLGVWVTPVICIHERRDAKPFRHHGVWVVPLHALLEWIRSQRNASAPFERVARFADGL